MPDTPPSPPDHLPSEVVDALDDATPKQLRDVARYAETLAEHEEREVEESADQDVEEPPDDHPDGVPAKASTTIKEINGNRYYYWQWRDGDKIRSQYKGPVDEADDS